MAAGNKIPLWAFGFLYWSLHLTHSLKGQALIQERTQCSPKGLRGPTTGGLNHLRNLSHHYLWQTNHNRFTHIEGHWELWKHSRRDPHGPRLFWRRMQGWRTTSSTSSCALKNADWSSNSVTWTFGVTQNGNYSNAYGDGIVAIIPRIARRRKNNRL